MPSAPEGTCAAYVRVAILVNPENPNYRDHPGDLLSAANGWGSC